MCVCVYCSCWREVTGWRATHWITASQHTSVPLLTHRIWIKLSAHPLLSKFQLLPSGHRYQAVVLSRRTNRRSNSFTSAAIVLMNKSIISCENFAILPCYRSVLGFFLGLMNNKLTFKNSKETPAQLSFVHAYASVFVTGSHPAIFLCWYVMVITLNTIQCYAVSHKLMTACLNRWGNRGWSE